MFSFVSQFHKLMKFLIIENNEEFIAIMLSLFCGFHFFQIWQIFILKYNSYRVNLRNATQRNATSCWSQRMTPTQVLQSLRNNIDCPTEDIIYSLSQSEIRTLFRAIDTLQEGSNQ